MAESPQEIFGCHASRHQNYWQMQHRWFSECQQPKSAEIIHIVRLHLDAPGRTVRELLIKRISTFCKHPATVLNFTPHERMIVCKNARWSMCKLSLVVSTNSHSHQPDTHQRDPTKTSLLMGDSSNRPHKSPRHAQQLQKTQVLLALLLWIIVDPAMDKNVNPNWTWIS